ncbi:MAG: glycerophosphodiester phosphodiesterase [Bacteroidales bacterium]|nr:glycerophosphodiester phosphodiesterase [Bacteroidales bacterium]
MLRAVPALLVLLAFSSPAISAEPVVEIIAHRGASHDAPENTVAAIRLAWKQKADLSEFDIYLTRDGQLAVIHDKDTKRTAPGSALVVAQSTMAELRKLDVGKWKDAQYTGERIPTLAEMLAAVPPGKGVFIEVKCGPEAVPAILRALDEAKLPAALTPVICFNADVIAAVKKARPDLPAYWLVGLKPKKGQKPPTAASVVQKAQAIHADGVDLSASPALDAEYAKVIRAAGLKLYVWTVNDLPTAKRMVELGVDGITTDRPAWLREQLAK